MYTVVYTHILSFLKVSKLLHSNARVNPYTFGRREKFGLYILNAFYAILNLAPGLQRLQCFDLLEYPMFIYLRKTYVNILLDEHKH